MLKNELRIGNYVYDADNDAMQIAEIFKEGCSFIGSNIKNIHSSIKPIPLTEEWLLKFGFELIKGGIGWDSFVKNNVTIYKVPTSKGFLFGFRYSVDNYTYLRTVNAIQNLYYALTNTELIWNGEK